MKKLTLDWLIRHIATYFLVFLIVRMDGAFGRSDVKTKLLLQNIRTHLAQKADDIVKEKECGLGLILCKSLKDKAEEEEEEEILPPPKPGRGQHKPRVAVKPKDVIRSFMPKVHKNRYRMAEKPKNNEKHEKLLFFSNTGKNSLSTEESKNEFSDLDGKSVEKSKKPQILLKQKSVTLKEKFQKDIHHGNSSKMENEDLASENISQYIKKTMKTAEKSNKTLIKEKKTKTDERELIEKFFLFSSQSFIFALDSDNAQRNACEHHTHIYLKQLKKFEIWALMMYDATAKLTSGILQGNTNQYGDFDQCLSVNAVFKKSKRKSKAHPGIKGKYCLANVDLKIESESNNFQKVQERIESLRFIKSTIHDPAHFIPRFSTMNWGLCVPSTCLAEDVEKFLRSRFELMHNASGVILDVKVEEDNCVTKDDLKFKFQMETLIAALFYFSVLIISLYATCLDAKAKSLNFLKNDKFEREMEAETKDLSTNDGQETSEVHKKNKNEIFSFKEKIKNILMAFSIKKNLEKLLSDKSKGSIGCVDGVKSILTIFLYFAHKTISLGMTPFSNRVVLTKISNEPATVLLRASIIYTDSFLLISGMLTAYNLAQEISEKKEISWIKRTIGRFIRLTPPLLAVLLFYAYIWDQLGSGPIWNAVVKRNSLLCRRHMWRNLLYIQNFFQFENMFPSKSYGIVSVLINVMLKVTYAITKKGTQVYLKSILSIILECAPQTHQLALDMQLSLLAPLFVHLMHTYDKVGIGTLQALFFLSSIMRYIATSKHNLSVVIYHGMSVSQLYKTANLLYAQAIHRASPYILGTVVGYHLKKFEKRVSIPRAVGAFGWITALICGYYSFASPAQLASRTYKYDVQEAAQHAALLPVTWSLALSWVIAACHLGLGGKINEFLCKKIFLVFSRISYSIYLTQFLVFFYKIGVKKIPEMFTLAGSFNFIEFSVVIVISVIVTLFFDIPTMEIKKILLHEKSVKPFIEGSSSESLSLEKRFLEKVEKESETVSDEFSEKTIDELIEGLEDEEVSGDEDEDEDEDEARDVHHVHHVHHQEENDENPSEEKYEDNDELDEEMIEAVFQIRPLTRSTQML